MDDQLEKLTDNLDAKIQVLEVIQRYNIKQEEFFLKEEASIENFDDALREKGELIGRLNQLNDEFDILHKEAEKQLKGQRSQNKLQIAKIKEKVTLMMQLGDIINEQEKKNKKLVEQYFAKQRTDIAEKRKNSKAAYDYYQKSMLNIYAEPQFYDNKK